jgi:hypothetical protein
LKRQRPGIVEQKQRVGDVEMDLVIGKNHKGALLTINDRATGMLKMGYVESKEAAVVQAKAVELLLGWKELLHSVTTENAGQPVPKGVCLPQESLGRARSGLLSAGVPVCQALPQLGKSRAACAELTKIG